MGREDLRSVGPPVPAQADIEGLLDVHRFPPDFEHDPVGGDGNHRQVFRPCEGLDRQVVGLAGAIGLGELPGGKVMPVEGAFRIANLFQEFPKLDGIPQG